ncbi:MAG: GNAT family N-acetyltransferase [Candidatus Lokiarchaeota archaeon]
MIIYKIEQYKDVQKFYNDTKSFLLRKEVKNNLVISILKRIQKNPHLFGDEDPLLLRVLKNGIIQLAAIRTPPYSLVLSDTSEIKSIKKLVKYLADKNESLPGIIGFKEGAKTFAEDWSEIFHQNYELGTNERIYKLEEVNTSLLKSTSNELVQTDENYEFKILNWAKKFIFEALPDEKDKIKNSLERTKKEIKKGAIFLLLNQNIPVSMARMAGETLNGRIVNLVYTPPKFRKKGYATELVAKLSQHILDLGYKFCLLFTDLSNPTSNKIYMNVGYKPITDVDMYNFSDN